MRAPIFYRDQPVFGFDLGFNSVKVIQIDTSGKAHQVVGYGFATFKETALKDGVVVDHESIAKQVLELFTDGIIGTIDTRRVVASLPVAHTFSRILALPAMAREDLGQAVLAEAEQYIPVPQSELYLDYQTVTTAKDGSSEVLVVAAPRKLVDSYLTLFDLLGLEVALLETSISAGTRLVAHAERSDLPTLIIDFGSVSTDLSIFDTTLRVTGTIDEGGDTISKVISDQLGVTPREAQLIKTKHGLNVGRHQVEIKAALEPLLAKLVEETKRMVRFYQERSGRDTKLGQVVILGGGANMPGLADYLTDKIRLPVRVCNPWLNLEFGKLQPPHPLEKTLYATAAGLALVNPKEVHSDD